jgi:hypothetical protein
VIVSFARTMRPARVLPPRFSPCGGWVPQVREGRAAEKVKT